MSGRPTTHSDTSDAPPEKDVPAVAYVRMSTDHQKYSTENQLDVIRSYAEARGLTILRTFEDSGRSGLRLDGREALQNLMAEVQSGHADFKAILVYDVSRWGRFQDADEGAYHEHVCSRAGIRVHYCGEQFENDGSIGSNLLKTVKRVMAGEYSRELSVKVFAGQCRLVELGYRQGGAAGYGLRRVLIDEHGNAKGELSRGEQKSLQTDRVILVPGPEEEQRVVQRMYEMFVNEGRPEGEIAEVLNAEGHRTDLERPWTRATVHQVLTNEKYIGNNVFNKVSFKLKQRRVVNPRDMWIRAEGAYPAIVGKALFLRAREIVDARSRHFTDEELLDALRAILKRQGTLSGLIIDEENDLPSSSAYRSRFGSLLRAYRLIGYEPERDYRYIEINKALRAAHPQVVAEIIEGVAAQGGCVVQAPDTQLLRVNDEFTVSVVLARCQATAAGSLRWHIRLDTGLVPDITIAVRMNATNNAPRDFYLLPSIDMTDARLKMAEQNGLWLDARKKMMIDETPVKLLLTGELTMLEAGSVITSQVDLIWSVALALLLAEVYLVGRFLEGGVAMQRRIVSWIVLFGSIGLQVISMLFGYLTYGSIVTMARCAPAEDGRVEQWCNDNSISQATVFSDAEFDSLIQFGGFGIGLLLFVLLFAIEPKAVAKALKPD